jgi:anti-sigma-K factor RskA
VKHSVANRLLNLFVGDDLPNGMSVRVKAHVEQCDACQSEVALLRGDQDALHAYGAGIEAEPLAPEMGERFWFDIRRELRTSGLVGEQATQRPAAAAWWTGATLWRGLAAAAVLVAGVMIYGPFGEAPSEGPMNVQRVEAPAVGGALPVMETHMGDDLGLERVRTPETHRGALEPIEPFSPVREQRLEWQPGAREVHGF